MGDQRLLLIKPPEPGVALIPPPMADQWDHGRFIAQIRFSRPELWLAAKARTLANRQSPDHFYDRVRHDGLDDCQPTQPALAGRFSPVAIGNRRAFKNQPAGISQHVYWLVDVVDH